MINDKLQIKLIDFAFSIKQVFKNTTHKATCGTRQYMSPEIVKKQDYCPQPADIWAIAVIIMRMRSGYLPFAGKLPNFKSGCLTLM
jgi:serine/threonine protein kinase